jgi:tripartite-type tricarboxylate transporter receptor subunit TctC
MYGVFTPAKVSPDIVRRLSEVTGKVLRAPDIVALQARIQALEEHITQMHALASPAKTRAKTPRAAPSPKAKTPTARARKT